MEMTNKNHLIKEFLRALWLAIKIVITFIISIFALYLMINFLIISISIFGQLMWDVSVLHDFDIIENTSEYIGLFTKGA